MTTYIPHTLYKVSRNACFYSVQNILSSMFLSKNLDISIFRTLILPGVFMDVKLGR
jgi:hypothetical protein